MFRLFVKPVYRFVMPKSHFPFQDILMLQRLPAADLKQVAPNITSQGIHHKMMYYIYFQSQRVYFKEEDTVLQLCHTIKTQLKDVAHVSIHAQESQGEIEYASHTPMELVVQDDMIVKLNQQEKYVVLNKVDNPPVIDLIQHYPITQHPLQMHFQKIDVPQRMRVVLSNFIQKLLVEIEKNKSQTYDSDLINLILKKVILKFGLFAKTQKQLIDQEIAFLIQKEQHLSNQRQNTIKILEKEEQTILYQIYFYILCQVAFTQYGTYMVWGWDVMEPVTFMLGVTDMIIGYQFWMRTTKQYTFDNVLESAVNRKLDGKLQQIFNYKDELNDVQLMIEYLKFKQMIYSTNIDDVINVIEGAIEEQQTKLQEQEDN